MNARKQRVEVTVEGRQIEEALSCLFHTLLLHRSVGKFHYKAERNYSIGILGTEDVDCEFIDLTYVRISSKELCMALGQDINSFRDTLALAGEAGRSGGGVVTLEFYHKKRRQWPLPEDLVPWEVWHLHLNVLQLHNKTEHDEMREKVGEALGEIVLDLCSNINRPQYQPKMPIQSELSTVFDTRFSDVQPYLFRISHQVQVPGGFVPSSVGETGSPGQGISSTVKRLLKDTLSM